MRIASPVACCLAVLLAAVPPSFAQTPEATEVDPDTLRAQWPQMDNSAFIEAVVATRTVRDAWQAERLDAYRKAIYGEAARRMLSADENLEGFRDGFATLFDWTRQSLTEEELGQLLRDWLFVYDAAIKLPAEDANTLVRIGSDHLTPEELAQVQADLTASLGDLRERSLADIKDHLTRSFYATPRAHQDILDRRSVAAQWVEAHDLEPLSTDELVTLFGYLRPYTPNARAINVRWTGWITPPRTGEYQFDVSPITISTVFENHVYSQDATVKIDGVEVLTATSLNWDKTREKVTLTAGQPVEVSMSLVNTSERTLPRRGIGLLYWSGPGLSKQVVPAESFRGPEGVAPGLLCRVDWVDSNNKWNSEMAQVAAIDQVFNESSIAMPLAPFQRVATMLLERMMAPEAFTPAPQEGEAEAPPTHPIIADEENVRTLLNCVSSETRAQFARELARRPELLSSSSDDGLRIFQLFEILQPGAEREALDVLGVWMQANPNPTPEFDSNIRDFFNRNRYRFRQLCVPLMWQHAESFTWLQDEYLETDDGGCSLPAAYVIAYGYALQGKHKEWVAFLEEKLKDDELQGDQRVNWLIARAMAEEIALIPAKRHSIGSEQYGAGDKWLILAEDVASTPTARSRVQVERVTRATVLGEYDFARALLQRFQTNASELELQIAAQEEARKRYEVEHQQSIAAKRIRTLERRREAAERNGDSGAAQGYSTRISTLSTISGSD